ncbi:hypothetical protein FISHEDRAFT_40603 [Fistulina hepatica ATCC 64428]|uniref:Protein BCP1 n=1 Tax=Fistulina hepatica ATCC 64428 TaxID=1128425 RepID=A0A0D7AEA1_9AGAR|nr:hypothetical protein FISHEDRAFT_40603 [Fistulina hepatica ATCC 64428]
MSKRKQVSHDDDKSDSDVSLVNVDFDFFDPNPDVDYHAIKRLLGQLFQRDADLFPLHDLTELILSQPEVGSTIKTDGKESDPYALLTVLNMHVHQNNPAMKALAEYILDKAKAMPALHADLVSIFAQTSKHVGLIICERLINMPVQVIPPMYRMLIEEIERASAEKRPFDFSHYIVISRTYHLTPDEEKYVSANTQHKQKSKKKRTSSTSAEATRPEDGIYSFHPEDDVIIQFASHVLDYCLTKTPTEPRNAESFGLDTRGRIMLVPHVQLPPLSYRMSEVYAP